jgi:hypothetical protein
MFELERSREMTCPYALGFRGRRTAAVHEAGVMAADIAKNLARQHETIAHGSWSRMPIAPLYRKQVRATSVAPMESRMCRRAMDGALD